MAARDDLDEIARRAWDKHGISPDDLYGRMTPNQFVILFFAPAGGKPDRVEVLRSLNDDRGRRGLKPVVPSWL